MRKFDNVRELSEDQIRDIVNEDGPTEADKREG